jgi:adenosylhomocysteine nucleosidase
MSETNFSFPLGLVVPTRWEVGPILKIFQWSKRKDGLYETQTPKGTVLLAVSGVGMEAARKASYRLCNAGAKCLVSVGFCGALSPALRVGDVLTDRVMTSKKPASTPAQRAALASRANALAVDMETQAVIEAGTLRAVPIRVVRVVSDTVEDDLSALFGSEGNFSPVGMAFRLLNPRVWPLARRLGKNSRLAGSVLAQTLKNQLN